MGGIYNLASDKKKCCFKDVRAFNSPEMFLKEANSEEESNSPEHPSIWVSLGCDTCVASSRKSLGRKLLAVNTR